jgi:uncharacterized protein YjbI with pentapeptide repeats
MYSVAGKESPHMINNIKRVLLAGNDAKQLWIDGKDAWNSWVDSNPEAHIDFKDEKFQHFNDEEISFKGYKFPNTYVDFSKATFSANIVDFSEAVFPGGVSFNKANFSAFRVLFYNTRFDGNEISQTSFFGTIFSDCIVTFNKSIFVGDIIFYDIKSKNGKIHFHQADFKQCDLFFTNNRIESPVEFNEAEFGCGRYIFEECNFFEHVDFTNIINTTPSKEISFKHSSFHSSLDLSGNNISTVIDLTNTKITNQVSLTGLNCKLNRRYNSKARNPHDAVCFMRLKEIAASNNDHQSALSFHANEMRAKRWQHEEGLNATVTAYTESLLDTLYGWLCDYGQSIMLPVTWFLIFMTIFTFKYAFASDKLDAIAAFPASFMLSISNSIPFLQSSKSVAKTAKELLFYFPDSTNVYFWLAAQGSLSFVFIFLIGLGLRNRFKI